MRNGIHLDLHLHNTEYFNFSLPLKHELELSDWKFKDFLQFINDGR